MAPGRARAAAFSKGRPDRATLEALGRQKMFHSARAAAFSSTLLDKDTQKTENNKQQTIRKNKGRPDRPALEAL